MSYKEKSYEKGNCYSQRAEGTTTRLRTFLAVILAPSQGAYHIPQALAPARQFPLFSLQLSTNKEKKIVVHIALYGHKEASTKETLTALANVLEEIQLAQELVDSPPYVLNCHEHLSLCTVIANYFQEEWRHPPESLVNCAAIESKLCCQRFLFCGKDKELHLLVTQIANSISSRDFQVPLSFPENVR